MNFLIVIGTALLLGASIFGYTGHTAKDTIPKETAPKTQVEQPAVKDETKVVRRLVEDFGHKLQMVSLSASPELVAKSIRENYKAFLAPTLIDKWLSDPQKALGRVVSSPWPDRIEISTVTKVLNSLYKVTGKIVEVTSVEQANGRNAATRPVTLIVKKTNHRWLIEDVTAGTYDAAQPQAVVYQNKQYGFKFALPDSWRGYTIVMDKWVGNAVGDAAGDIQVETGPLLSIRHPQWTVEYPRQDIPIMVFTLNQWDALQKERFHIGAAPIGPRELGRNQTYVFALPARYNFAFLTGFEEVETILNGNPLTTF